MTPEKKFTTQSKPVSRGAKTKLTVFCDGVDIGSRTSARPYRYALVVTRNQSHAIRSAQSSAEWNRKNAAQYTAIANRDETAIQSHIREGYAYSYILNLIDKGSYAEWAKSSLQQADLLDAEVARLSAGPLPEFAVPFVASWHQSRKNVPKVGEHLIFVAIVEVMDGISKHSYVD